MSSRRIIADSPPNERQHDHLKHVAGLVMKLTFREMGQLSDLIADKLNVRPDDVAEALLDVSDSLIAKETTR